MPRSIRALPHVSHFNSVHSVAPCLTSGGLTVGLHWTGETNTTGRGVAVLVRPHVSVAPRKSPCASSSPRPPSKSSLPPCVHTRTYDTEIRGLLPRVQPGGQKTWYLRYRLATGRRRIKLGAYPGLSPDGARTVALCHLGDVAAGVDVQKRKLEERVQAEVERSSVLGVFIETSYGTWCRANLKTGAMHVDRLEADFGHWWQLPMRDVTPAKVDAWRKSERERGVSARTVNRNLSRLRSTLAKAVERGLLETNPIASIKRLRFDKTLKVRYPTPIKKRVCLRRWRSASRTCAKRAPGTTNGEQSGGSLRSIHTRSPTPTTCALWCLLSETLACVGRKL